MMNGTQMRRLAPKFGAAEGTFGALTPEGRDFVIQTLDTFHDTQFKPAGFPGGGTANTVIQRVRKTYDVLAPTGVTGNWDCHIALIPCITQDMNRPVTIASPTLDFIRDNAAPGSSTNACTGPTPGATFSTANNVFQGLMISKVAEGFDTLTTPAAQMDFVSPSEYLHGPTRVVSAAFEAVNRTAQLYRQGDVTCYKSPEARSTDSYVLVPDAGPPLALFDSATTLELPPNNITEANIFPSSVTWAAEDGAYVQGAYCQSTNQLEMPTCSPRMFRATSHPTPTRNFIGFTTLPENLLVSAPPTTTYVQQNPRAISTPFNTSGAYFTGLSNQTTLRITVIWVIERVPTAHDHDLVVLAAPAAPYDNAAIRMVIDTAARLPPGCKQSENPKGEWWKTVVKVLKLAVPVVMSAAGLPEIGVGLVAGMDLLSASRKALSKESAMTQAEVLKMRQDLGKVKQAADVAVAKAKAARKKAVAGKVASRSTPNLLKA
jgi:hypothetical protein